MDKELLQVFVDEMNELQPQLKQAIKGIIQTKMQDPHYYETYGQIIDRIYGTAMTMGMTELGEFTKTLKDISYMASNSDNEKGKEKAGRLMIEGIELFKDMVASIHDKEALNKIKLRMNQAKGKAEILNRKEFYSVNQKSC
jgi:chemotaxis protein histidine kinase CheA